MSCTTIFIFGPDGETTQGADFQNAWGGAIAVWGALGRKYLTPDERDPNNVRKIVAEHDNPLTYVGKVCELADGDRLLPCEKVVLQTTFDNAVVKGEDLPALAEAFAEFTRIHGPWFETNERVFSIGRQGKLLETLVERDDVRAVAWRQTSVIDTPWHGQYDEETGEETPYNLDTMDTHWFIKMPAP